MCQCEWKLCGTCRRRCSPAKRSPRSGRGIACCFHGGHIPDGEQIVTPPRFSFFDLPREQQIFGPLLIAAIVIGILVRAL